MLVKMTEESQMTPTARTADCKICHAIMQMFTDPFWEQEINLGSYGEATSTDCQVHKPLVDQFVSYCRESNNSGAEESTDIGLTPERGSPTFRQSLRSGGLFWDLLLEKRQSEICHVGQGVVMDRDWVDLSAIKKWKRECFSTHGAKCQNPTKIWHTRPAWLVDVQERCIVAGSAADSYIALSYRWGDAPGVSMRAETMARLQLPNALDDPDMAKYIPPMVHHAIYLTSALEERYLWVDTLCIVHGDKATAEQLSQMGSIYANAEITIIAADTVAQEGIPGLRDVRDSRPRDLEQKVIPFGDEQILVRNTDIFSMSGGTEYYSRAWTYQEYMMAKRKILFNRKEVHWECQCRQWHEELIMDHTVRTYINPRMEEILAGFPNLSSLSNMIGNYNELQLRYDEDALPGIAGLLSILSRSFGGGFVCGIPELFFDRALAWKAQWGHINLWRRTPSGRPAGNQLYPAYLPSWSWVGWEGLVNIGSEAARINHLESTIEETIPITQWYTGDSPTAAISSHRKIRSQWYDNREFWKSNTDPLPAGWSRVEVESEPAPDGEPLLWPDGCGKYVYRHKSLTETDHGPTDTWFFPFPVPNIQESTPPSIPEQTPFLYCKTKQARVWARRPDETNADPSPDPFNQNILNLHTNSGTVVGSLHLHNEEQLKHFLETAEEGKPGEMIAVVSISLSRVYSKTWNKEKVRYDYPCFSREHYNVLWVEWQDGVAYRLASGQIDRACWDQLEPEDVDLILG